MNSSRLALQTETATWFELSDAAHYLGIHFTTLRRWADEGKVPSYRTPGGRRRFRSDELAAFLNSLQRGAVVSSSGDPKMDALKIKMKHLGVTNEGWYQKISETQREAMRGSGRELMAVLMQYTTRTNGGEAFLQEGRRLAACYGEACRQAGLTLIETLQAFLRVRQSIFDSVYDAGALAGSPDADTWRLYDRMNAFLDAMLLATVDTYAQPQQPVLPVQTTQTGDS